MAKELVALLALCISCVWSLDICEDQIDGAQILYPTDCSKYVVCRFGQTYAVEQCNGGRHFNRLTSQCDDPTEAACDVEIIKNVLVNSEECNSCRTLCGCLSESDCITTCPASPTPASPSPASPTPASPSPESPTPASPTPESPTPASPTPASPTPESPTPASPTPESPTPASPTPESPTPASPTPASPTPESPTPASPTPESPTPASPTPASPTPESATPASPTPESPTPASPTPASPTPDLPTPASPTPESPTPASPTPESPTPASPTPESPTPASPNPESPTPASPTPASPTPESPTPESPTPESPTPASPTPASPTPDLPTPASPTPDSPTPASPSTSCLNELQICVGQPDYSSVYLPDSCSQYAICISECANVLSCPNNLLYDLATHSCTYPENANCPYPHSAPTGPSAGPSGTKCEQHGKCENQPDGSLFADDTSSGYIVCQCECEIARPCPATLVFNDSLKVCDFPPANY